MSITLYTAPDCLRCKIVKGFLAEHQIAYETVDFKADAQTFNTFYRANRKAIYRNPEGVEFPLFDDGTVIKQGSGEVIAYLLSGHALEGAVTRSDLLHVSMFHSITSRPAFVQLFVTFYYNMGKSLLSF